MKKKPSLIKNFSTGWNFTSRVLILSILIFGNAIANGQTKSYESAHLKITELAPGLLLHESYLHTQNWGKVGCNGMIYISKDSAYIFDTPASDTATIELLRVLKKKWKIKVKGVVVNHYHNDCLAGLTVFHEAKIPSYSSEYTRKLAGENGFTLPQHGFDKELILKLNGKAIINRYFGEGHTRDNIVSYIPEHHALFGGCLVKALGAGFGHVGDANLGAWAATVKSVQQNFPDIKLVVPGHGKPGDASLLDFTAKLFEVP